MSNNWLNYNISQQTYSPRSFNDVITNKYDVIHQELYESAKTLAIINAKDEDNNFLFEHKEITSEQTFNFLNNIIFISIDEDGNFIQVKDKTEATHFICLDDYKITEVSNSSNYLIPTKMSVIKRGIERTSEGVRIIKFEVDLSDYWNSEYELSNEYTDPDSLITNSLDDWYKYNDIIKYDYINEKALLENRVEMKQRKTSFKNISVNDTIKIDYLNS